MIVRSFIVTLANAGHNTAYIKKLHHACIEARYVGIELTTHWFRYPFTEYVSYIAITLFSVLLFTLHF